MLLLFDPASSDVTKNHCGAPKSPDGLMHTYHKNGWWDFYFFYSYSFLAGDACFSQWPMVRFKYILSK